MAEEAFICLGDTWGGKHVKTFEIQSRKTETMLLAEFFIQNHLYTFRCWTASDLFTITADDSSPVEVDQQELYLIFPVGQALEESWEGEDI